MNNRPADKIELQGQATRLLIGVSEACKLLSISRATYFVQKASGRIGPAEIKFGRKILLRQAEIEAWAAAGCPPRSRWAWGRVK
jgi:excisionase family DNA binding protein